MTTTRGLNLSSGHCNGCATPPRGAQEEWPEGAAHHAYYMKKQAEQMGRLEELQRQAEAKAVRVCRSPCVMGVLTCLA